MFQNERNVGFNYLALGAYIESTDGFLYKSTQWQSAGKTANCVVLIASTNMFRLSLNHVKKTMFPDSYNQGTISSYIGGTVVNSATHFNGEQDTQSLINFLISKSSNTTTYAAPYCHAANFLYGNKQAYLPSSGQVHLMFNNRTILNECISVCGGDNIPADAYYDDATRYWSSSYSSYFGGAKDMLIAVFSNGRDTNAGYNSYTTASYYVRPVADYE